MLTARISNKYNHLQRHPRVIPAGVSTQASSGRDGKHAMQTADSGASEVDIYRFEGFEVRVRTGVLLHEGERIKVQELPFRVLLVLLETPGQIVSQDVLQARLWSDETFAHFDSRLRVAMRKLRDALGDKAAEPRFIRTLSGQGYQFIAKVVALAETPEPSPPPATFVNPSPAEIERSQRHRSFKLASALVGLLAVAIAGVVLYWMHRPLLNDHDAVVVGGFANSAGDADFSSVLSPAFRVKLEESPYLRLISDRKFRELVPDPASASLQEELKACLALNGQVLLRGQVVTQSSGYQVLLKAWKCKNGSLLTTQSTYAQDQQAVIPALNTATEQLRRRLGESEASLKKFSVPLSQATTSSLAALKAFTMGEESHRQGKDEASLPYYKLAINLDPQFAIAYARLGSVFIALGDRALSSEYYQKAFNLRTRTTDRERLYIAAHNYTYVTGEVQNAIRTYEVWQSIYPRDVVPMNNLAVLYLDLGEPQKALPLAQTAVQWAPDSSSFYGTLAMSYLWLGEYAKVRDLCHPPNPTKDPEGFYRACAMEELIAADSSPTPHPLQEPADYWLLEQYGLRAAYHGRLRESTRYFSKAEQTTLSSGNKDLAASLYLDQASLQSDMDLTRDSEKSSAQALALASDSPNIHAFAALAMAKTGNTSQVEGDIRRVAAQAPLDTIMNNAVLASAHAMVELQKHDPQAAIQSLELAHPFDFCAATALAPAYYRGLAYLQNQQPDLAAHEFQRVLDHRALAPVSPYVVLSMLGLGRAQQLSGNQSEADRAYKQLEGLWKDADSNFPPLKLLRGYEHMRNMPSP